MKYISNELLKVYSKYKMQVRAIWQLIFQDLKKEGCSYRAEKPFMYCTRNVWFSHPWNYRVLNVGVKYTIGIATVKCRYAKIWSSTHNNVIGRIQTGQSQTEVAWQFSVHQNTILSL